MYMLNKGHLELWVKKKKKRGKEKERWPKLLKAATVPESALRFHYKHHIMAVNTITKLHFLVRLEVCGEKKQLCSSRHTQMLTASFCLISVLLKCNKR